MTQKLTRPKQGVKEVLLNERDGREVYRKLHIEVVKDALPELKRLVEWKSRSARVNMILRCLF